MKFINRVQSLEIHAKTIMISCGPPSQLVKVTINC